jgi:predicted PurR-regulated permease PerM
MANKTARYFTIAFVLFIIYLSFLLFKPFYSSILGAMIISYLFYPVFNKINTFVKNKNLAILIMVLLVSTIILVPMGIIANKLLGDLIHFYADLQNSSIDFPVIDIPDRLSFVTDYLYRAGTSIATGIIDFLTDFITTLPEKVISTIVFIFSTLLFLKKGPEILGRFKKIIPMEDLEKDKLLNEFRKVTNAVIFGMFISVTLQGILAGVGFWLFGIPQPVFWGFVIAILSFVPLVGAAPVFLGGFLHLFLQKAYLKMALFVIYVVFSVNVDQLIIPRIIGRKTRLNPILSLIGILSGLRIFGLVGIFLGPLVLSLMVTIIKFYTSNFKKEFKL